MNRWIAIVTTLAAFGCGGAQSAREQDLEVRLAKAEAELAQIKADKASANRGDSSSAQRPRPARDEAQRDRDDAEREAAMAVKDAREAAEQVEALMRVLEEFEQKLSHAIESVAAAQTDADRSAATAKLKQLQKEHAEMQQRAAAARAAAEKAKRRKGNKISNECLDNPLAKGCP